MSLFIKSLSRKKFSAGENLEADALIVAQKILCKLGFSFIPKSYVDFLYLFNGIKANGAYLFGASVDDDLDIVDKNKIMTKPENSLLLGYNDFDLLVFNFSNQCYQIIDRDDFSVLDEYNEDNLDYALAQIFNV